MKKKMRGSALLTCTLALSLFLSPAASAAEDQSAGSQSAANSDIINEIMQYVEMYNITGVDKEMLIRGAIDGMVQTLDDPYSEYMSKEEAEYFQHMVDLQYVGIGVRLQVTAQEVYIEEVLPGSPAQAAGARRGDVLNKINGVPIAETRGDELDGKPGTKLSLQVLRAGAPKTLSIIRKEVAYPAVSSKIVGPKIGYIALSSFSENAGKEFETALAKLRGEGMKSLVLDLRDNTGGYMEAAYQIASQFIKKGVMMYTADQSGALTPVVISGGKSVGVPVVVLANENSASASEALIGALRDNKLATIVGTRTFGKARIQSLLTLSNGGTLKLTTERYLTPSKEDFNHIGLSPDVQVKDKTAQLITALKLAGMTDITAAGDSRVLDINGSPFAGNVGLLKKNNSYYASAKVLAALVEGNVAWDAKNHKVIVTAGTGKTAGFPLSSKEGLTQNGETYIRLDVFSKQFPTLKWTYSAGTNRVSLSSKLR